MFPSHDPICCNCGHEFESKEKIQQTASEAELVKKKKDKKEKENLYGWAKVKKVEYRAYQKNGKNMALIVDYHCGLTKHSEYVFIEGRGFGKHKANNWIKFRWNRHSIPVPRTVADCITFQEYIDQPKEILVDANGKYTKVLESKF